MTRGRGGHAVHVRHQLWVRADAPVKHTVVAGEADVQAHPGAQRDERPELFGFTARYIEGDLWSRELRADEVEEARRVRERMDARHRPDLRQFELYLHLKRPHLRGSSRL